MTGVIRMADNFLKPQLFNCFDEEHQVIIGHDYGNATWIQVAEVLISERIINDNVKMVGKEISVNTDFFDKLLKPLFLNAFDPNMPENKNRYTYAYSDEGRYINCFEDNILEPNFFTYSQVEKILEIIEDYVRDGAQRIEKRIGGKDAIQLVTFTAFMRRIMAENPKLNLISVSS